MQDSENLTCVLLLVNLSAIMILLYNFSKYLAENSGDRGSTVVKVLCYKSEGHWFDSRWCQWIFH
jgi:hypothetical protein